ncbi:MAG: hypothetical protein HGA85_09100 [Nanoarchaeota archaeon]|nr:hypothetical protein [Nanoarchaeota archaeon]
MQEQENLPLTPGLAEFFPERVHHKVVKKYGYESVFWIIFSFTILLSLTYFLLFTATGETILNSASILISYLLK